MTAWSKEVFAKNLRKYMDENSVNQKELAEIAGVSPPTVNDWLKANIYPRIDKIERIANHFDILKSDLIEDKNPVHTGRMRTPVDVGLLIREKRLEQGLTQAQLGSLLGCSAGTIANIERGNAPIKRKTLRAISDILNVSILHLIGVTEEFTERQIRKKEQRELWQQHFGDIDFTDIEFAEIINYAQFVLSKRPASENNNK